MTELQQIRLDELLVRRKDSIEVQDHNSYKRVTIKTNGLGISVRDELPGTKIRTKRQFIINAGQLLLSKIDARNGAFGIVPESCDRAIITGNFWTFDVNAEKLDIRYLNYLTKTPSFVEFCIRASEGTTNRRYLREHLFLAQRIPLPPLAEQRRIVARIEALAGKVEEARRLRETAVAQTGALLATYVTELLSQFSVSDKLGSVLNGKPRNGWSPRCDNAEDGTPVLTLSAVTGFHYDELAFKRTSLPTSPDGHYWLKKGDLLITRSNTLELVGHAAIYNGNPSPCIYSDLMMRVPIDESLANPRFVHWWLQSVPVRDYIKQFAKGTSPTMKKISQQTVVNIPFPVKVPRKRQEELVAELDRLQSKVLRLRQMQAQTQAELDALLPAILDKAFKGAL